MDDSEYTEEMYTSLWPCKVLSEYKLAPVTLLDESLRYRQYT